MSDFLQSYIERVGPKYHRVKALEDKNFNLENELAENNEELETIRTSVGSVANFEEVWVQPCQGLATTRVRVYHEHSTLNQSANVFWSFFAQMYHYLIGYEPNIMSTPRCENLVVYFVHGEKGSIEVELLDEKKKVVKVKVGLLNMGKVLHALMYHDEFHNDNIEMIITVPFYPPGKRTILYVGVDSCAMMSDSEVFVDLIWDPEQCSPARPNSKEKVSPDLLHLVAIHSTERTVDYPKGRLQFQPFTAEIRDPVPIYVYVGASAEEYKELFSIMFNKKPKAVFMAHIT